MTTEKNNKKASKTPDHALVIEAVEDWLIARGLDPYMERRAVDVKVCFADHNVHVTAAAWDDIPPSKKRRRNDHV